ncbi:type II toxin-antitoxin system RelE/ParE family toxin [Chelativorans alearense]|uniref:type II toxin-antitoxin system RelE family toxin n=1 Tax=Chelativorans alearense TaxID=2681495 RepID=UPI0031B61EC8
MAWTIEVDDAALRQLKKLGRAEARRIHNFLRDRIGKLDDPRQLGRPMQGSKFGSFWRYHVGDYRIICDIQIIGSWCSSCRSGIAGMFIGRICSQPGERVLFCTAMLTPPIPARDKAPRLR